jgi:hypothetical protein
MADNVEANAGTGGATFATDEITGVQWPFTKQAWGPRDTANEVDDADGKRFPVKVAMAGTATRTAVNDSAAAVELLAANANRKAAYILNTSSAVLYVGLGTVDPSASDFTEQVLQWASWRVPDCFTGQIKGIWASDPNDGVARVTELT